MFFSGRERDCRTPSGALLNASECFDREQVQAMAAVCTSFGSPSFFFLPLSPLSWQPQCKLGPFDGVLSAAVCDAQSVCVGGAADKVAAAACKQYSKLRANETLIKLPVLHPLLLQ